jgi:hypothetical protein
LSAHHIAPEPSFGAIAAGPLVNVVLVAILLLASPILGNVAMSHSAYHFVRQLLLINVGLLIFNLLPVYPLDGGQILRALLWFLIGPARSLYVTAIIGVIASLPSVSVALTLEGTTAPGDSGGPAFADFGNGLQLVGLTSWGVNPTNPGNLYGSGLGDITYLTRVSTFDQWILGTIPEPSLGLLLAVGIVLTAIFCRRKTA